MNQYLCTSVQWLEDEANEQLTMIVEVPDAKEAFHKLLEDATQFDLSFGGGEGEHGSVLTFILRNGNGEMGINLPKQEWSRLLDEPDKIVFEYGEKHEMDFLPRAFFTYIDQQIDRFNEGEESPFLKDIIEVFAEEDTQS